MEENITQNTKSSYRSVFKATSLFGGVQVYTILIEIIKSKIVAVLLGPTGVGIQGLYNTGTKMIQNLSSCGLSTSAVQSVAAANASGDLNTLSRIVTALRRLVWVTGLLGMLLVVCFSPLLSKSSFGDYAHIWGFVAISITLLFNQLNAGQKVVLQGTRRYRYMAKCSVVGATLGLVIAVPLFYIWNIDGIVPNIIVGSFVGLLLSTYYSRKVPVEPVSLSRKDVLSLGKSMLVMGVAMSVTQFLAFGSTFVQMSYIRSLGGVEMVGLFSAGTVLMTEYTGLVFQALGTDFYPRLAAVNTDNEKCAEIMNHQGELGLLLLGPLMCAFMIFIPIAIKILYTDSFLSIDKFIVLCSFGVILQMASWSVSYVFIAKADSKLFTINEVASCLYGLALNILGYYLGGLTGMGFSFILKYLIYTLQVYIIAKKRYDFSFTVDFYKVLFIQLIFCTIGVLVAFFVNQPWRYVVGFFLFISVTIYSLHSLNQRMDLYSFVKSKLQKNNNQ